MSITIANGVTVEAGDTVHSSATDDFRPRIVDDVWGMYYVIMRDGSHCVTWSLYLSRNEAIDAAIARTDAARLHHIANAKAEEDRILKLQTMKDGVK